MGHDDADIIIVGAGLGGLWLAAKLAAHGRRVLLLEGAAQPGGRGQSKLLDQRAVNMGPHALYLSGPAAHALRAIIPDALTGHSPPPQGTFWVDGDQSYAIPYHLGQVALMGHWPISARLALAKRFVGLAMAETIRHDPELSFGRWLDAKRLPPETRTFFIALARVATYMPDPEQRSANVTLRQLKRALIGGVRYLDGGWQSLVDALVARAQALGVTIRCHQRVERFTQASSGSPHTIKTRTHTWRASQLVLAIPPERAAKLLGVSWTLEPVFAACLDLVLDAPLAGPSFATSARGDYLSIHSRARHLGFDPRRGELVHVARYLRADEQLEQGELEAFLSRHDPRWREHVRFARAARFPVCYGAPTLGRRRPSPSFAPGIWLVGDWVELPEQTPELLLDAVLHSAQYVASQLLAHAQTPTTRMAS